MIFGVIVSVTVRPDKPRHFGLSSRQRTTRTRGVITRCRKIDFSGIRSGSGESWFDPRRGNLNGGAAPIALALFIVLPFPRSLASQTGGSAAGPPPTPRSVPPPTAVAHIAVTPPVIDGRLTD